MAEFLFPVDNNNRLNDIQTFFEFVKNPPDVSILNCILSRHENSLLDNVTQHLTTTYSLQLLNDDGKPGLSIWAKRCLSPTSSYYVISLVKEDLILPRSSRSIFYLGKLLSINNARVYSGVDNKKGPERKELVTIVFDHERGPGDRKMEVGIPLDYGTQLHSNMMNVRHEGGQNVLLADKILFFHQCDDDSESMKSQESLQYFDGKATQISSKNFQLIISKPARLQQERSINTPNVYQEMCLQQSNEFDFNPFIMLQLGKYSQNKFICTFRPPFSMLQVFMICLSRFETLQRF